MAAAAACGRYSDDPPVASPRAKPRKRALRATRWPTYKPWRPAAHDDVVPQRGIDAALAAWPPGLPALIGEYACDYVVLSPVLAWSFATWGHFAYID